MSLDAHTELFRHKDIAVTRSWIMASGVQHAVRYVDQTSLSSSEPPRSTALIVLFVCLVLALVTIFRIVAGDFSMGLGWVILIACAVVVLIAGHTAFVRTGTYHLTIRFKDGETISVATDNASRASKFQSAVHEALDLLDYHDTEQAAPTVVLASLEPTQLTAVSGPKPAVIKVGEKAVGNKTPDT